MPTELKSTSDFPVFPSAAMLGLMAKFWTPGSVKTRLGATIGMYKSAQLHKLFVQTLTRELANDQRRCVVSFAPREKSSAFSAELPTPWKLTPQCDGDIGRRMCDWFSKCLILQSPDEQSTAAILIGADCPTIDESVIRDAIESLVKHDVVIGPALDGGYYLIAIKGPWSVRHHRIFEDIPWSTDQVLKLTLQRLAQVGLSCEQLEPREDIDTADSLNRLTLSLAQSADADPKHARLLHEINSVLNTPEPQ